MQVERIAETGSLNPRQVKIPGVLVDCVVVAERPEYHMQTFAEPYSAAFSRRAARAAVVAARHGARTSARSLPAAPLMELKPKQRRQPWHRHARGRGQRGRRGRDLRPVTLTAEPGVIGGMPAGGLDFGAAVNPDAIIDQPSSSTSTTAAGWTSRSSDWRRPTATAT